MLLGALGGAVLLVLATVLGLPLPPTATGPSAASAPPPGGARPPGPSSSAAGDVLALDTGSFAAGGCVVMVPPAAGPGPTVVVDAGHGGPDPGAEGETRDGRRVLEKELTLAVALDAARQLRDRGFRVVLSRSTDALGTRLEAEDVAGGALRTGASLTDLTSRARCANRAGAQALVSVHFNSFGEPSVRGTETVYEQEGPLAPASGRLALGLQRRVQQGLVEVGRPSPDRGLVDDSKGGESSGTGPRDHLVLLGPLVPGYIDEPTRLPAALVEPMFITNPDDLGAAITPVGTAALGRAVARGVEDFVRPGAR